MPHTNRASVEIARAPDEVFPWLVEPAKRLRWVEGLESSEPAGDGYREVFAAHGIRTEVDVEVRRLEPPYAVDIHLRAKQFEADGKTTATAIDAGTRVESRIEAEYKGFMAKAAAPMITRQAQGSLERSLQTLKSLLEGSSA